MKEIIDQRIEYKLEEIFPMLPAKVISFDPDTQTITAQPVMYELYPDGVAHTFPKIDNVPVMFPSGGGGSLTFPIKTGDYCILINSARDFDEWVTTGNFPSRTLTARKLDYNDCVAIVGVFPHRQSLKASTENVELQLTNTNGSSAGKISIAPDNTITIQSGEDNIVVGLLPNGKLKIQNSGEELVSILSEFIEVVANNTTATIYGASPMNSKPQLLALKQRLDTFKE